jgi:hypothetical protein
MTRNMKSRPPIWWGDQVDAASRDASAAVRRVAAELDFDIGCGEAPDWLQRVWARHVAATRFRGARRCGHLRAPGIAVAAAWRPGQLACPRCIFTLAPTPIEDKACDRCDVVTRDGTHPGAVAIDHVLLTFGLCGPCRSLPLTGVCPPDHDRDQR